MSMIILFFILAMHSSYESDAYEIYTENNTKDRQPGEYYGNNTGFTGYTLFTPVGDMSTYLINNDGEVIHQWDSEYIASNSVYLLGNGDLLRSTRFQGPGVGGFQKMAWDGSILAEYQQAKQHHDIAALPNGNVLMIVTDTITRAEAIAAGRDPDLIGGNIMDLCTIVEAKPNGTSG